MCIFWPQTIIWILRSRILCAAELFMYTCREDKYNASCIRYMSGEAVNRIAERRLDESN